METRTKIGLIMGVLFMMGSVSAALLTYYGTVNSIADVTQSVEVIGGECINNECNHDFGTVVAGNTYEYCDVTVRNNADGIVPVRFETTITDSSNVDASNAVTVRYLSTVRLASKNSTTWELLNDGREATVTFEILDDTFNYDMKAKGLVPTTDYSLIYYADPWAGNHDGALLGTFTTDTTGIYSVSGVSINLDRNMPNVNDANYNPIPNYCDKNNIDIMLRSIICKIDNAQKS